MLDREGGLDVEPLCASKMSVYEESENAEFWILNVQLDFETSGWLEGMTWLSGSPKFNLGYHTV